MGTRKKRNFGYGRRMDFAAKQALKEKYAGGHYGTVAAHTQRFTQFARFLKERYAIPDMRKVTPAHVIDFAGHLNRSGRSVSYRQNCLSSINTVMGYVNPEWEKQSPRGLVGEALDNVRHGVPASLDRSNHDLAVARMREQGMERAASIADLARNFGLRMREAVLADVGRWQKEAKKYGAVNVQEGTKGGRNAPRWVPVDEHQKVVIHRAVSASPEGSQNLLGQGEPYKKAVQTWIKTGRDAYRQFTGGDGYHAARAAYACQRYRELTHHDAPVVTGSRTAGSALDKQAREVIGVELGHNRENVTNAYIGGRGE